MHQEHSPVSFVFGSLSYLVSKTYIQHFLKDSYHINLQLSKMRGKTSEEIKSKIHGVDNNAVQYLNIFGRVTLPLYFSGFVCDNFKGEKLAAGSATAVLLLSHCFFMPARCKGSFSY